MKCRQLKAYYKLIKLFIFLNRPWTEQNEIYLIWYISYHFRLLCYVIIR